jgi:2-phosphosulfolactate phosphatase
LVVNGSRLCYTQDSVEIKRATLDTCSAANGSVVVIDVMRAFTTAAYAFAAGARDIVLTGSVDEALSLRRQLPGALTMGEAGGLPIPGFDFGNSPSALVGAQLTGRRMIQRTSAGTQGVVRSSQADRLLACSLVCASATARCLRRCAPALVTFVITGLLPGRDGDEDAACADFVQAMLQGPGASPDCAPFIQRVRHSTVGRIFADPAQPMFPAADLECCLAVDRFDFAMPVTHQEGRWS